VKLGCGVVLSHIYGVFLKGKLSALLTSCRVLDPILHDIMDPSIQRTHTTIPVRGRELQGFQYERPFDQRYISYLLEILLSVIRFGGQGFFKAAKTTMIRRSPHSGLIQRLETGISAVATCTGPRLTNC
jgi:hypothetical protein